ncbi:MAG: hypothetical protein ACKPKS_16590 [Dolichospermum sp.]
MANIVISELHPAGSDFFIDSESFLYELTDNEIMVILGGKIWPLYNLKGEIIVYVDDTPISPPPSIIK